MTGMSYEAYGRAYQRILFDGWRAQIAAGHLSLPGLLALRTRLTCGGEFELGADLYALVWLVNDVLAATRGSEPPGIPSVLGLTVPDDASGLAD